MKDSTSQLQLAFQILNCSQWNLNFFFKYFFCIWIKYTISNYPNNFIIISLTLWLLTKLQETLDIDPNLCNSKPCGTYYQVHHHKLKATIHLTHRSCVYVLNCNVLFNNECQANNYLLRDFILNCHKNQQNTNMSFRKITITTFHGL
jgi:hypothetical protein